MGLLEKQINDLQEQLMQSENASEELQRALDAARQRTQVQVAASRDSTLRALGVDRGHHVNASTSTHETFQLAAVSEHDDAEALANADNTYNSGSSQGLRPFADALAALRPLVSGPQCGAERLAGNSRRSCDAGDRSSFDSLSFTERTDLLDLVAVVRGAEPLITGALGPSPKNAFAPIRHHSTGGLSRASQTSSAASLGSLPAL